jgi:hypothetical protein
MLLILGANAVLLGAIAADRTDLTPPSVRARLGFLSGRGAVNHLLKTFALVALAGFVLNVALFALWVLDLSSPSLLGVAGLAQAAILFGLMGIASVVAADFSRESIWQ